jgi:hypothetical protein
MFSLFRPPRITKLSEVAALSFAKERNDMTQKRKQFLKEKMIYRTKLGAIFACIQIAKLFNSNGGGIDAKKTYHNILNIRCVLLINLYYIEIQI